jgi:hypothetical protein
MTVLVDTSVLGRLANSDDPSHWVAGAAVLEMRRRRETLLTAAQNLIEFRNFALACTLARLLHRPDLSGTGSAKL